MWSRYPPRGDRNRREGMRTLLTEVLNHTAGTAERLTGAEFGDSTLCGVSGSGFQAIRALCCNMEGGRGSGRRKGHPSRHRAQTEPHTICCAPFI